MSILQLNEMHQVKIARKEDLEIVLDLLFQAAIWLQSKDTTQWDYYITDLEGNKEEVLESIKNNSTYIVEENGKAIATITLEDYPTDWDCDIWGENANDPGVVYLHRIVVHRDHAGKNIGYKLIEWAKEYVNEKDKKFIRFDCLASNQDLNNYYQKNYKRKGIANIYGQHSKYEIEV
ncbi:GNAT family N-acetyltransferase [Ornithinibacillus salinisoli]|uniref:GNAT family N-acetyltransferase n=1 Tax=Ornithinibacillus salinisoli TaxID=1848459 RepID=A0ABW4W1S0_9BACI